MCYREELQRLQDSMSYKGTTNFGGGVDNKLAVEELTDSFTPAN